MAVQRSIYEILTIEANDQSQTVDLMNGAMVFDYYEDIFSPTITAKLKVINVGNTVGEGNKKQSLYNGLPLRGGERVALKIAPNSTSIKTPLDFSSPEKYFYVSSITDVVAETNRESFTLNLTSREAITNETTRVVKKFPAESKISDSVTQILEENLLTEQIKEIEETSNVYAFIGNLKKPFTVLVWLASKSVPAGKDGNAGFFFYQTKEGFSFRSIDSLTQQEPKAKYTYSQSYDSFDGPDKLNNDFKIYNYYVDRNQNLVEKLRMGAYASDRMFFNPLTFTVTQPQDGKYSSENYKDNVKTLGGNLKLPKIQAGSDLTLGDVPTRIFTQVLDVGTLSQEVTKDSNSDPSEYQSQTLMRYNLLLTQSLSMMVPCNLDLNAGDVIECEFPQVTDSVDTKEYDEEISGLYIIKELCHHFDTESSYTSMKLVRDTFGVKKK
jgi:hypothetical protein